jgi:hypothetical protein
MLRGRVDHFESNQLVTALFESANDLPYEGALDAIRLNPEINTMRDLLSTV